jgi:hypothetical protein
MIHPNLTLLNRYLGELAHEINQQKLGAWITLVDYYQGKFIGAFFALHSTLPSLEAASLYNQYNFIAYTYLKGV